MQERVYRRPVNSVEELKKRLLEVWSKMEQCVVDEAIDQWRIRLNACVNANGKHFEHLL